MVNKSLYRSRASRWLSTIVMIAVWGGVAAQSEEQVKPGLRVDVNLYNRFDDPVIDSTYMKNKEMFDTLDRVMRDTSTINHTGEISVVTSSSIEGPEWYNRGLSRRRMVTMESLMRSRYHFISSDLWRFSYTAENWDHLRRAVAADESVPNQKGVLEIIDMTSVEPDKREAMLKELDGGRPWRYIHTHILPYGRGSVSLFFCPSYLMPYNPPVEFPYDAVDYVSIPREYDKMQRPIIALRTNLILDAISAINLGVEVPLAPRWSVAAQIVRPWWHSWARDVTLQTEALYFDVRYWFGKRGAFNNLSGFSLGAYAGSGRYDVEPFSEDGCQGEYSDYGLTLSHSHYIGDRRRWLLEFNISLGLLNSDYRKYHVVDDTKEYGTIKVHDYPWSEEHITTVLPTRLGVTLVYVIKSKGGKR